MKSKRHNIEIFDDYLTGKLTDQELLEVTNRLNNEPEFRKEYEFYKIEVDLIKRMGLRKEMGEIINSRSVRRVRRFSSPAMAIAASIALLISVTFLFLYRNNSSNDLFKSYYQPYPNILSVRSEQSYTQAFQFYNKGNYAEAVKHFNADTSVKNDTALLYLSQSYLSLNKPYKALEQLKKIQESSIFYQQSVWYTALAQLKTGQKDSAVYFLRKIQPDQFKYAESQKLLNELQ